MESLLLSNALPKSIYTENPQIVAGATVVLHEVKTNYILHLTDTQTLTIDTSQLSNKANLYEMSFNLVIDSDGHYVINFQDCNLLQLEFYRGISELKFTYQTGFNSWKIEIVRYGGIAPTLSRVGLKYRREFFLSPCLQDDIYLLFEYCTSIGQVVGNYKKIFQGNDIYYTAVSLNPFLLTQVAIHTVNQTYTNDALPGTMEIYGSNDFTNWQLIYSNNNLDLNNHLSDVLLYTPDVIRPYKNFKFHFTHSENKPNTALCPMSLIGIGSELLYSGAMQPFPNTTAAIGGYEINVNTADGISFADSTNAYGATKMNGISMTRSSGDTPWKITYTYPSAVRPYGFRIERWGTQTSTTPNWFAWYGSDDGTNWDKAIELNGDITLNSRDTNFVDYMGDFGSAKRYWQFRVLSCVDASSNKTMFGELYPFVPEYQYAIFQSIVPVMMSNEQDGYTVSASSATSGYAYYMYDRNDNTYCEGTFSNGEWSTTIDMGDDVCICGLEIKSTESETDRAPMNFKIQGSADGSDWTDLSTQTLGSTYWVDRVNCTGTFEFDNETSYQYYRILVTATAQGTYVRIAEIGWTTIGRELVNPVPYQKIGYLVPVMTSNSQDGYIATGSSVWQASDQPYKLFNRDSTSIWASEDTTDPQWVQIQLPEAQKCNYVKLTSRKDYYASSNYGQAPTAFTIQGSNDGTNWDVLTTQTGISWTSVGQTKEFALPGATAYSYYKIVMTARQSGDVYSFGSLDFVYELKKKSLVPTMSSNSQNGYTVSASDVSTGQAYYLFDSSTTNCCAFGTANQDSYVTVQLPTAQICNFMTIYPYYNNYSPLSFSIQASNDGETYNTLESFTVQNWADRKPEQFPFANSTPYLYYRFATVGAWSLSQIELYNDPRREYSLVPIMHNNTQDGYIASASSEWPAQDTSQSTAYAYKAFNGAVTSAHDSWQTSDSQKSDSSGYISDVWLQIQMPTAKVCNYFTLCPRRDYSNTVGRVPRDFTIVGSNDGTNWTELLNVTGTNTYTDDKSWELNNTTAYSYYRMNVTRIYNSNTNCSLGAVYYEYLPSNI